MNRVLGHLCAHVGSTGPGESALQAQNSTLGPWRPITLLPVTEVPHNIESLRYYWLQCWLNVGRPSTTVAQHRASIGSMALVI